MPSHQLEKWHAYHIWCAEYLPPHHQKCICVCAEREWFLFINSEPPQGRKSREFAIELSSHEAHFLTRTSYVNPTPKIFHDNRVNDSLADSQNCFGSVGPSLTARLKTMISVNPTLTDEQKAVILGDEPPAANAPFTDLKSGER
jgi:hypothetical protein